MSQKKAYQYPWRYNNSFKVLVDGNEYFTEDFFETKKVLQLNLAIRQTSLLTNFVSPRNAALLFTF